MSVVTPKLDRGREAEFEAFVLRSSGRLLHAARLLTGSRPDAEDLVQAVLVRMYVRWPHVRQADPYGYARRALGNAAVDAWRRRTGDVLVAEPPDRPAGEQVQDGHADRDEADRALSVLTARERAVVVLRFYEDMTEADVAAALGMPLGSVKSTGHRALGKLRARAADHTGTRGS